MASMFIRHRITDYEKWKPAFDANQPARVAHGATGHSVHRDADDPNTIIAAFRVNDIAEAKAFAESDDLRQAMQDAGVEGPPTIWFAEDIEEKTY